MLHANLFEVPKVRPLRRNIIVQCSMHLIGRAARIVIAHDMTDRINHIKAIESQNERLKEISWMQSHVIRAPLSRIMGLIDVLNLTAPDETENIKILEFISFSANELDSVIRAITDNANGA